MIISFKVFKKEETIAKDAVDVELEDGGQNDRGLCCGNCRGTVFD